MSEDLELRRRIGQKLGWRWERIPADEPHPDGCHWVLRYPDGGKLWREDEDDVARALPAWEASLDAALAEDGPGRWLAERGCDIAFIRYCANSMSDRIATVKVWVENGPIGTATADVHGQEARLLCELFLKVEVER
jgi:hypothetical protein